MVIRFSVLEEREEIEVLSQTDQAVKDLKYLWRFWKNWKPNSMPIVAREHGRLIAFHAASFGKKYVNTYFRLTLPEFRGQGVGRKMRDFLLAEAQHRSIPRYKFKMSVNEDEQFWTGHGVEPFGRKGEEFLFDVDISEVCCTQDLKPSLCHCIPENLIERYEDRGVEIL